uniref:Uncharacterized protein n=1 Tax=Rhizophora mucronata TaxID=61149 RepID=A0A2P2IQC3_RHIMU
MSSRWAKDDALSTTVPSLMSIPTTTPLCPWFVSTGGGLPLVFCTSAARMEGQRGAGASYRTGFGR